MDNDIKDNSLTTQEFADITTANLERKNQARDEFRRSFSAS